LSSVRKHSPVGGTAKAIVLAALLFPTQLLADAPSPAAAEVTLVRDLIAGSFVAPAHSSRQVNAIRAGVTAALTVGMRIAPGEAVRSDRGVAVLRLTSGASVSLGEGSQLRIGQPLVHRIGTIFYESEGSLDVRIADLTLRLENASMRLRTDSSGQGLLEVLTGQVSIGEGGLALGPGQQLALEATEGQAPSRLGMGAQEELALWRAERFLPGEASPPSSRRFVVLIGAGMSSLLSADWVAAHVTARVRLGGEAWLDFGAGVSLRPGEVDEGGSLYWSVPIHLGARWIRPLRDSSVYFGLGAVAELLLLPGCLEDSLCSDALTARPGVLGSGIAGVRVHPKLSFEVIIEGGVHGFAAPNSSGDLPVVMPQFGLSAAMVFRP
jgi:hypothetical protein